MLRLRLQSSFLRSIIIAVAICASCKTPEGGQTSTLTAEAAELAPAGQKYCQMICGGKYTGSGVAISDAAECRVENAAKIFGALPRCPFELAVADQRYQSRCAFRCTLRDFGYSVPMDDLRGCNTDHASELFEIPTSQCQPILVTRVSIPNYVANPVLCKINCGGNFHTPVIVPHPDFCSTEHYHEIVDQIVNCFSKPMSFNI
ncbi:MAG: hypothetical protein NTV34_15720 [Proteobacteria bacterium]|nr:hypothetical protein [Pseudomonadota bacterium]